MNKILLLTCLLTLLIGYNEAKSATKTDTSVAMEEQNEKKLRHVVLFKFKENTAEEAIKKAERAFSELPSKIDVIKEFEWGINNSPEGLDKGFTHCYFITFDSEEGRDIYLPHPDHKAFGEIISPILEDVLVVDYWVGD